MLNKVNLLLLKYVKFNRLNFKKLSYFHNTGDQPLLPLTFGKLLDKTCQTHGDIEAIVSCHQNQRLTFNQVLKQVDKLAAGFRKVGLQNGDRLGLWAPNTIEWYITNLACAKAGLVMVAINPAFQPKEMEYCINKVGIKAILMSHKFKSQNFYDILKQISPSLECSDPGQLNCSKVPSLNTVIVVSEEELKGTFNYNEIIDLANNAEVEECKKLSVNVRMDDPCNIQFTSGTTGSPKAAVISHFQLVNNGYCIGKRNELNRKQHKICAQVPLFHAFGTVITISAALNYGTTLVLPSLSHDPEKTLKAANKERCTILHGTPTMYVDLINKQRELKEDLNVEIAVSGGAPCSPSLFKEMLEVLKLKKVKSVFGLSETTAVVFQSMFEDDEFHSTATVGYVSEHTEVKVVDENGLIVPKGTRGELCVRGYFTMLGYWEDEEKTKETIGPDNWLKTGDQFILEPNGYGRIVGRLKEMIIRGGENIFPKEIEDFLNTHPEILETYVVGLPHTRLGEEVCACIRVKEKELTLDDIKSYCKGNLSHYKIPSVLRIMDSFPKTASGKIQKHKIVQKLLNEHEK